MQSQKYLKTGKWRGRQREVDKWAGEHFKKADTDKQSGKQKEVDKQVGEQFKKAGGAR